MPDTTTTEQDISTSGGDDAEQSQDSTVLTPEQRDAQTFARYGMKPDGSALDSTDGDGNTDANTDDKTQDGDDKADDTTDADDGNDADSDEGTAGSGADDSDDGADPEITDEDVENVVAALEDRLVAHPKLAARIKAAAEAEAAARFEEQQKARQTSEETEALISKGRTATKGLYDLIGSFGERLGKAAKGEEFDPAPPDFKQVQEHLGEFGAAVVAETRRAFDRGYTEAFRSVAQEMGVKFSQEDINAMTEIFNTTARIEGDPEQGREPAIRYLYGESWKMLAEKVKEQGRAEALAEVKAQRDAAKKIKGENAETAAIAKIVKQRKGAPPKPTAAQPTGKTASGDDLSEDAYRAAKAAGNFEEADRIVQQRALLARQGR